MKKGVVNNRMELIDEGDYKIPSYDTPFSPIANSLPLLQNSQAPRGFYGSRFFEQTLPLSQREAPLVRSQNSETGRSWDFELGKNMGAVFAPDDGTIEKLNDDEMHIRTPDGKTKVVELYNKHPFNRNTLIHNTPKFKKGDTFKKGQVLATSNYTDDDGRMALGSNAKIAIVPFEGKTMDDAGVISESYAKRLTSTHANMIDLESDDETKTGKGHFISMFPKTYTQEQLEKVDDDGYVKPGTILQPGDPVRLATRPKSYRSNSADVGRLSRAGRMTRKDDSATWDGQDPATVLDVVKSRKGDVRVLVSYEAPARPGDKLTLRNGQKLTITEVIPDERAPKGEDGKPIDLLLNQLGLPSRVNFSTFGELLLGKIAQQRGEAFTLPAVLPEGKSMRDYIEEQLIENGVDPEETIFDPRLGRNLDQRVTTGYGHVLKLHHTAGKKLRYRGKGGYDINRQPLRGGADGGGAQRLSGLEMSVLHSSGARGIQKESVLLRGDYRPEYWRSIRENRPPPTLDRPFVWDKFTALLQGSGVNTRDMGGGRLRLTPLTDKDLDMKEAVELINGKLVNMKTMEPERGGLFDPDMTRDQKWGKITLPVAMINPAYEAQVRTLLGLTQKELDELLDGVNPTDEQVKQASIEGLQARLRELDLDKMKEEALADIRSGKKTKRAAGVKKLRAVQGLQRAGVSPEELIITKVPVVPAGFRPYTVTGETFLPGDANELYADLIKAKEIYAEAAAELGPEHAAEARQYLRRAARAAYGYEDSPNAKLSARKVKGMFKKVVGTNPKNSFVQGKLISKPQDHVGRSVISPDPTLTMDQISIPEDMAWELFGDHVEGALTAQGMPKIRRLQLIKERSPVARAVLEEQMTKRPVVYSRAPAWHRHNVVSGYARINEGKNIKISPLVTAGMNADYDGDTMAVHVPVLPEAVKDAQEKILPSKMLFSIRSRDSTVPAPKHESLLGMYAAQTNPLKDPVKVKSYDDALRMYDEGKLRLDDQVDL